MIRDQISHEYETKGKIIVLYILTRKSKVKLSRYTPWRRFGGEEV
jgi:hypothetical protein